MTDWAAVLKTGLALGIGPEALWRLSLREWRLLTGGEAGLKRNGLEALMARWPDGGEHEV
ncbi:phage tail assembly chaperone [Brevundimonas sp. 2R-24]|uniref:Phage tail assembly chaperone n=1 Tax=Peiella sedimenti TaxID=3061083 RepID=A0ABT8SHS2_9CAUL|nr:phage tail assembly chaperone [Caulobacteraceae bacterium XZ-24]